MLKSSKLIYKEDLLNYWRAWLSIPILLLPAFTGMPDGLYSLIYGLAIWFILSDMNFLLHQHVHCPLTQSRFQNIALDWWLSIVTAMCAYNWRQQHVLRHHVNDNSWGEPTLWEFEKNTLLRGSVYAVRKSASILYSPLKEALVYGVRGVSTEEIDYRIAAIQHIFAVLIISCLMVF